MTGLLMSIKVRSKAKTAASLMPHRQKVKATDFDSVIDGSNPSGAVYRRCKMTNYEFLKTATKEELRRLFCDSHNECENCPVTDNCFYGNNGFITWLEKEKK